MMIQYLKKGSKPIGKSVFITLKPVAKSCMTRMAFAGVMLLK